MTDLFPPPSAPPEDRLTGKQFEELLLFRAKRLEERGALTMGRYGVQATRFGKPGEAQEWHPIASLPDFEGVLPGGRQFIIEAKSFSAATFPINQKMEDRQLSHMLERSDFNVLCFLVVHFNARQLTNSEQPAVTYAMPVKRRHEFWKAFDRGERKGINRSDCELYAIEIPWNLYSARAKKMTPDITVLFEDE